MLENLDLEEYRKIVLEMQNIEAEIMDDMQNEVCQKFKIDIDVFQQSFRKITSEHTQEFVEEMKENVLYDIENSETPKIGKMRGIQARDMSREFTLEVFMYEQELRKQAFKALERTKPELVKEEFTIQNEIACDRMFAKFKVEKETYNQAMVLWKLT